jgi:DNA-binding winged helix-turn-helix (wHTH) protein
MNADKGSMTFGEHRLDLGSRQLFRGQAEVHLSPKAFDLLKFLVEKRPQAVSKTEIYDYLWPGTFVTESNLASLIAELRRAIDDREKPSRFVRTVHGFGYSFCGQITADSAAMPSGAGHCWIVWRGMEIPMQDGENIIGRDPSATVCADLPSVSRRHARIVVSPEGATLEDLGSKNGTRLRNVPIAGIVQLTDLDEIQIGSVRMTLRIMRTVSSTQTLGN